MPYQVRETEYFSSSLEEAALWLYSFNLDRSESLASQKFLELEQEINDLKNHLQGTPRMGEADEISGIRQFPVYGGRYLVTWTLDDRAGVVTLLEFIDSKYPKTPPRFQFDE